MGARTRIEAESADGALALAQAEPARATEMAARVLARDDLDPVERVKALWALGLGRRELDDLDGSVSALRLAIEAGHDAGEASLTAEIISSQAWVMARLGDSGEALRLTDEAARSLEGPAAARNEMQKALVLQRLGENRRALESYAAALPGLEAAADHLAAARLRLNRSVIHVYSGALDEAVSDLETAYRIGVEHGQTLLEAACAHNLGFTHGRRGDIPRALSWFGIAEASFTELGSRSRAATLRSDRAEVYATAGLMRDALTDAEAAVEDLRREDDPPALADALLLLARIADLAGDGRLATSCAREARRLFASQGRDAWELMAHYLEMISLLRGPGNDDRLADALTLAARLDEEGWESEARRARIEAARLAFDRGDTGATIDILEPLGVLPPASSHIDQVAHAEAMYMLDSARGRSGEARQAVARGLKRLDRYRAAMGSAELRAGMGHHGVRLVAAAVDDAMAAGDPWRVLQAVDTWRARSMDFPPALPPDDAELAASLVELRQVESDLREAMAAGEDTSRLQEGRRRVEDAIRRATRLAEGQGGGGDSSPLEPSELADLLDGHAVVSYFARRGTIHAVWFDGRHWHMSEIGPAPGITDDVAAAVFSLSRLADAHGSDASLAAAAASLDDLGKKLSRTLIDSLDLPDSPLTIVPTGVLHRLPWNILPTLAGRPVSVAPSVRAWMRARRRVDRVRDGHVALVAGPDLDGARAEVEKLSRLYPKGRRLTGRNARVERVLSIVEGSSVAHLAAHGTFRSDNPLFSALRMTDGPLTVYDLERLPSVPPVMVMPACDSAVSEVGAGDELLGLAAALLRIGVSSLVAPMVPIPDAATSPIMLSLHRRIRSGASTRDALAAALLSESGSSPQEMAARAAFVLLGS